MPHYIIRITKQVEILEQVEETAVDAPSLAAAKREAAYLLGEKYADQADVQADVREAKIDDKKKSDMPF
jgi:hypothetical protein